METFCHTNKQQYIIMLLGHLSPTVGNGFIVREVPSYTTEKNMPPKATE